MVLHAVPAALFCCVCAGKGTHTHTHMHKHIQIHAHMPTQMQAMCIAGGSAEAVVTPPQSPSSSRLPPATSPRTRPPTSTSTSSTSPHPLPSHPSKFRVFKSQSEAEPLVRVLTSMWPCSHHYSWVQNAQGTMCSHISKSFSGTRGALHPEPKCRCNLRQICWKDVNAGNRKLFIIACKDGSFSYGVFV
jgi:hypothetical protein